MADGSLMDSARAAMKRGLIAFLVVDPIFIAGAVALYPAPVLK